MNLDPASIRKLAQAREDENFDFRAFLKRMSRISSERLDELVTAITTKVWAGIDCSACANCCKEVRPALSEKEVQRLAGRLGLTPDDFIQKYLEASEQSDPDDPPWRMRGRPCPFLDENRCSVYEDRPKQCQGYPYLYKSGFVFRTLGMLERAFTCPIVYEVMEAMKPATGFRPRHRQRNAREAAR